MKAVFKEMSVFNKYREQYLSDDQFRALQIFLLDSPEAGDVIRGTGGLRKLRWYDPRRGKGKRGGLRVIYYWYLIDHEFWLFTLYNKDETSDLSTEERSLLRGLLEDELKQRRGKRR